MSGIAQPALAAAAIVAAGSAALPAASLVTEIYQEKNSGLCAYQRFLGKVVYRFGHQVRHVFNQCCRAVRYKPEDERHLISRRYCKADAVLSDGQTRDIRYPIEGRTGFAGMGDNVESASPALISGSSMAVAAMSSPETPTADQVLG